MTEATTNALIIATPPTLLALAAVITSVRGVRKSTKNSQKLDSIHIDLNSRLTQLLTATSVSERASGKAEGMAEGRQLGISERADRVTESERVEDRQMQRDDNRGKA